MTYKTLHETIMEVANPKPKGEIAFKAKHVVQKTPDANGNGDDVFNGTKVKEINRKATFHGYSSKESEAVYEDDEPKNVTRGEINELSKKTLGSYIKGASGDIVDKSYDNGNDVGRADYGQDAQRYYDRVNKRASKMIKRQRFVDKAIDKLAKEEVELSETPHVRSADFKQIMVLGPDGKVIKRKIKSQLNVGRASEGGYSPDTTFESVEINELSKKTLSSYVDKAVLDVGNRAYRAGKSEGRGDGYDTKNIVKGFKRRLGISKAGDKLTKEEVELEEGLNNVRNVPLSKLQKVVARGETDSEGMGYAFGRQVLAARKEILRRKKAGIKESVEINELSKKTLGSYVNKASDDVGKHAVQWGQKLAARDEVDRITNRHMKYSDKKSVHAALGTTDDEVQAPRLKAAKRLKGIAAAVKRLAKEEVELSEVSARLLGRYLSKGIKDYGGRQRSSGVWSRHPNRGWADDKEEMKFEKKTRRRHAFMNKAIDKIEAKAGDN